MSTFLHCQVIRYPLLKSFELNHCFSNKTTAPSRTTVVDTKKPFGQLSTMLSESESRVYNISNAMGSTMAVFRKKNPGQQTGMQQQIEMVESHSYSPSLSTQAQNHWLGIGHPIIK